MKTLKYLLPVTAMLALGFSPALAKEPGTLKFYLGGASVQPDSNALTFSDPFAPEDPALAVKVDDASSVTIGLTYFVNQNWALDLFAALPFRHDILAAEVSSGAPPDWMKVGRVEQIPPTLSLQYYFTTDGRFDPYLGLGVNYTRFFDEKILESEEGVLLELDESFGVAAQLGADWSISDRWLINFDARFVDVKADVNIGVLEFMDELGMVDIGEIEIDPWVYSVNLGYSFE